MSNNVQGALVSCRHVSYAKRGKNVRRDRGYAGHWVRVLAPQGERSRDRFRNF